MAKFKSYGKDDKGFVEKYRAQILAGSTAGLKMDRKNKPAEDHFKNSEEYKDKMRGCILGGGDLTAQEFNKELYAKLRNGDEKAEEIEVTDDLRSNYVSFLSSGTDKTLTAMEEDYKKQEKAIKKHIEE